MGRVGWQRAFDSGFTMDFGPGLKYNQSDNEEPMLDEINMLNGINPLLQAKIGYGF